MKGAVGEVAEISTSALGIKFDGMDGIHKWHVEDELKLIPKEEDDEDRPMPNMRSMLPSGFERRFVTSDVEFRAEDGAGALPVIHGYAAVFDSPTELWPGRREVIRRGAFQKSLQESDQVALWNHDSNLPLARKSAGTLKLAEDDRGLRYEIQINLANTWERDAYEAVKKRSVQGSSFTFKATRENLVANPTTGRTELREVLEAKLLEVSPVTFPAYLASQADSRALALIDLAHSGFDVDRLLEEISQRGLTESELRASCERVIGLLDRGERGSASGADDGERDQMLRRLALAEAGA